MSYFTITYGGTEKTLADWGVAVDGCAGRFTSLAPDTLRLSVPGGTLGDEPVFAFEGKIILRSDRASETGEPDSFR